MIDIALFSVPKTNKQTKQNRSKNKNKKEQNKKQNKTKKKGENQANPDTYDKSDEMW